MIDSVLTALANPVRREALALVSGEQELCLCELMERLGVGQSSMSRHMAALRNAGIVLDRRDAQWVRYRRNPDLPQSAARVVDAVIAATDLEGKIAA